MSSLFANTSGPLATRHAHQGKSSRENLIKACNLSAMQILFALGVRWHLSEIAVKNEPPLTS